MQKLTEAQRNPLFNLVDFQRRDGREVVYFKKQNYLFPSPQDTRVIAEADDTLVGLWRECGYVSIHEPERQPHNTFSEMPIFDPPPTTLRLRQEALDYFERMSKPLPIRVVLDVLDAWKTDLRAAVIALVVSVAGTVLAALVLNQLGLLK